MRVLKRLSSSVLFTLYASLLYQPGEILKRAVKGGFRVVGETASRELAHPEVVRNTLAADSFSGAGLIGAITVLKVLFLSAFHLLYSFIDGISETIPHTH